MGKAQPKHVSDCRCAICIRERGEVRRTKKVISVSISPSLITDIRKWGKHKKKGISEIIESAVREYLHRREDLSEELMLIEPFDRTKAKPEFIKRLDEAKDGMKRGELISHEEVRREIFGE